LPELFTNQFFTGNTGRHKKLSFAAVFSYKKNNQKFIFQRRKRVNNADLICFHVLEVRNSPFSATQIQMQKMCLEKPKREYRMKKVGEKCSGVRCSGV
jgi:hypothetical protein